MTPYYQFLQIIDLYLFLYKKNENMNINLFEYINEHDLLYDCQIEFRKSRYTTIQLLTLF